MTAIIGAEITQPGPSAIRARSTSGLLCSDNLDIVTPSYAPFPTP